MSINASILIHSKSKVSVPVILEGEEPPTRSYVELRITPTTTDKHPGHRITTYNLNAAIVFQRTANIYDFNELIEECDDIFPTTLAIMDYSTPEPTQVGCLYRKGSIDTTITGKVKQQHTIQFATKQANYERIH
jgi:hypothetical protein